MNISPDEAQEALADIQRMAQKTRQSIATSGISTSLVITGIVWLFGYLATQFLSSTLAAYTWAGLSILGSLLATTLGIRMGRRVRSPSTSLYARRAGVFWLMLALFCLATLAVVRPADGKQMTILIILFVMIGQLAMGLLLSYAAVWWALPIAALALAGYFLLPDFFYLWMAILGGGGMIASGLYIRSRW